jgi:hypothetical protein
MTPTMSALAEISGQPARFPPILEVAKEVFTRDGGTAGLDDFARQSICPSWLCPLQLALGIRFHLSLCVSICKHLL